MVALLAGLWWLMPTADAQVSLGIKAGLNTTDLDKEELNIFDSEGRERFKIALDESNYGINIGLFLLAKSKRFYIQPEVIYNSSSTNYLIDSFSTAGEIFSHTFQEKYDRLDIPLMVGLRFGPLRIGGGPVGHVHLNSTSDIIDFDGYKQDFTSMTLGYQAGLGLDLWAINLEVRYEGNLDNFGEHFNFFGHTYAFSNSPTRIIGTIGISF